MTYRIEKEIQDDGCKILSMFDENDLPVCHFCTEPKTLTTAFEIIENCVVSLCADCNKELSDNEARLLRVDPMKLEPKMKQNC